MRRVVWGLVSVIGISLNAAAAATHDDAASACADRDPDIAIIACSVLIESGGEAPGARLQQSRRRLFRQG
jgi:hypothetical protein